MSSTITNVIDDGSSASVAAMKGRLLDLVLTTGIADNKATRAWRLKDGSIGSGSTKDIDLYDLVGEDIGAGDGRDALGQLMVQKQIVAFVLEKTGGAGLLELMPTNPANYCTWVPVLTVAAGNALKTGGLALLVQPAASALRVTDASSHKMRLGASGGAVTYDLWLVSRHYGT